MDFEYLQWYVDNYGLVSIAVAFEAMHGTVSITLGFSNNQEAVLDNAGVIEQQSLFGQDRDDLLDSL